MREHDAVFIVDGSHRGWVGYFVRDLDENFVEVILCGSEPETENGISVINRDYVVRIEDYIKTEPPEWVRELKESGYQIVW